MLIAASLLTQASISLAEEGGGAEQAYLQDFPVVLSASRLSQPLSEAPNAMTVIDRNMIKASGFRTIADLFRLVPGMYVDNLNGHAPIVAYHGSTEEYSRRMQVLIDGRSVYLPPFSSVDWEDIPLHMDDIERIEVVRGPAAASYGANSLQGVINIITRDAGSVNVPSLSLAAGDFGIADMAAHFGKAQETVDYRFTVAHREDSGYGSPVLNDKKLTNQANLRANVHPVGRNSFDFQLGYSDSAQGLGVAGRSGDVFRTVTAVSSFQQLTWLHVLQNNDELKLNYYHINRDYQDPAYSDSKVFNRIIADRQDLEMQHTAQLGASNRLVWGAGIRSDYVSSPVNLAAPYTINQTRLFAHDEWKITPAALINVGSMLEDDGMGHTNSSPRMALNYHLNPQQTLRAGSSVAYRTPATVEEKAYIPGSYISKGGVRPEKSLSREVGYLGEFNTLGLTLDLRAYDDQVSDIIFVDPSLTYRPFSFANLYSANYRGYESTLKYRWSDSSNVMVNLSRQFVTCTMTGTLTNSLMVSELQKLMNECPLSVPDYGGSILLTQQLGAKLQFSAGYYHQGGVKMINGIPQTVMNRVDFRLAQSYGNQRKSGSGEIALVLQNAFEDNYTKFSNVSETNNMRFKQRAYVTASLNF